MSNSIQQQPDACSDRKALDQKASPYCGYPGCREPAPLKCSRCKETNYCSKECQKDHWKFHKKLCFAPGKKKSAPMPPAPPVPLKGSVEDDEDTCIICLDNVTNAKLRPCGHSATCKECTLGLGIRNEVKKIARE
ncbi:hypothetical protein TrLO_g275 [Triparma laevis f. longispina]|uniref:MYND-type domain-containing protein n=1 Tax=Triparma laevis f. longispina TaxID=1714387 RepID=A0A9W7CE34_9STRA|nr:hypothetical protein TrLO_g275 [Triparma laevis f. longispina]